MPSPQAYHLPSSREKKEKKKGSFSWSGRIGRGQGLKGRGEKGRKEKGQAKPPCDLLVGLAGEKRKREFREKKEKKRRVEGSELRAGLCSYRGSAGGRIFEKKKRRDCCLAASFFHAFHQEGRRRKEGTAKRKKKRKEHPSMAAHSIITLYAGGQSAKEGENTGEREGSGKSTKLKLSPMNSSCTSIGGGGGEKGSEKRGRGGGGWCQRRAPS